MRILVINQSDIIGGAAIAAHRLCKGLEKFYDGVDIYFLVGKKSSLDPKVICTRKISIERQIEKIIDFSSNRLGFQYVWFPFSTNKILAHTKKLKPDLIYLRNIHGGYFDTSLLVELSKRSPIVWTLSDMWSFTGHCAHTFGDTSWKYMDCGCPDKRIYPAIGRNTGRWLLKRKLEIYRKSKFTVVAPSRWLSNHAVQSPVFRDKEVIQIYNGFDLDLFKPKEKFACRISLDLPVNAKVIMFSARFVENGNPWKGGAYLMEILNSINKLSQSKIHLLVLGEGRFDLLNHFEKLVVHHIGYINSDILLATCYSASDLFIYPTKADNLPNVLIEAISCGTPCITSDIGGCGEIIENNKSGFVIQPANIRGFAEKVVELLNDPQTLYRMSLNARSISKKKFNLENMCYNYYQVFLKSIENFNSLRNGLRYESFSR